MTAPIIVVQLEPLVPLSIAELYSLLAALHVLACMRNTIIV
jgi:hypothetical protein